MGDSTASRFRRGDALLWTLQILLAVLFLYQGVDKFSERRLWLRIFEEIGFGQWFRYFTGACSVKVSGIFWPRSSPQSSFWSKASVIAPSPATW